MRKLLASLALVAAACGGGSADVAAPAPAGDVGGAGTTAVPQTTTTTPPPDPAAPVAPEFSLALADGGDFVLSAEQRPVYMVFWAEW